MKQPPGDHPVGDTAIDANEQFATRLSAEVAGVLGAGITLEHVSVAGDAPVVIRASCLIGGRSRTFESSGVTLLDAARDLIRAAAELRLSSAWSRMVEPERPEGARP
jgi:hypothetical protein